MVRPNDHSFGKQFNFDPSYVWNEIHEAATQRAACEPGLLTFFRSRVLRHPDFESALAHGLALQYSGVEAEYNSLYDTFLSTLKNTRVGVIARYDLQATIERDPACDDLLTPFLYFKGFHAIQTYRIAHALWEYGRKDFALYLQSRCASQFGVDIHPQAQIGLGIVMDHGTGIVIGQTATLGNNCTLYHGVTLGGTGNEKGVLRHPQVGDNVIIGAGAQVLGYISIGDGAKIAANATVINNVGPSWTMASQRAYPVRTPEL